MTTVLETRYRALLRILPAAYRAAWEEEMVATYLQSVMSGDEDAAEYRADYGWPEWSEVVSVLTLAVRLRVPVVRRHLGGTGAAPRHRAVGDAVRIIALLAVATGLIVGTNAAAPAAWTLVDWPALCCVPVAAGLAVHFLRPGAAAWSAALAALAATVLAQRLLTIAEFAGNVPPGQRTAALVAGAVEAGVVAALGSPVALRARRGLRRLPAPEPPADAALLPER